jgi:hypothetical protein
MSIDVNSPPAPTVATQVSEIVSDLQRLIEQEILLMRREIESDLRCRAGAAALLVAGVWILAVDVLMLGLSCVYLVYWLAAPADTDVSRFPLWACYASVTAALALIGVALSQIGWSRFKSCKLSSQIGRL